MEEVQWVQGPEASQVSSIPPPSGSSVAGYSIVSRASSNRVAAVEDTEGRAQLAKQIGQFIRHRVPCVSLLCRPFSGNQNLLINFAEASRACKRGSSAGSSVFVGLALQWQACIVLDRAGLACK